MRCCWNSDSPPATQMQISGCRSQDLGRHKADVASHPHTLFQCQSKEMCCRWKRNTILRCSVTTEITREDDMMGPVKDLEPIGSLHHPPCINEDCRLNLKPGHVMRLEKRQLVSRVLSDPEKDALLSRKRDKWFGQFQDEYPMPIGVMPFSRDPNDEPIRKKRKLRRPSSATNSLMSHRNRQSSQTTVAGPSRPRYEPVTEYIGDQAHVGRSYAANHWTQDAEQARDIKPLLEPEHHRPQSEISPHHDTPPAADNETALKLNGHPGITRITDHYLIPARQFDRMQAEKAALRARIAELEKQADQEVKAALKKKIAELKKERDGYKEEAKKAKTRVEELKSKALQLFG